MDTKKIQKEYLANLLRGDQAQCQLLIQRALDKNIPLQEIYEKVFAPSMVEIGRLWEIKKITVAQEHLATAITQRVIADLYQHLFSNKTGENKGKMILACVGDELHELGPRMLGDLIEMEGWDVRYLGANKTVESVFQKVIEENPDLVAISATVLGNEKEMKSLISKIKEEYDSTIPVMVGGLAFHLSPGLCDYTGGDFFGKTFHEALDFVRKVAKNKRSSFKDFTHEQGSKQKNIEKIY